MAFSVPPGNEIARTAAFLGGPRLLHAAPQNQLDAHDLLHHGLPGAALAHLVGAVPLLSAPRGDMLAKAVGISLRTFQRHRDAPGRRLNPEQSARAWKFAEIVARLTALLGSQAEAEAWLDQPQPALDLRRPIDLLSTPAGLDSVQDHLTRLEYGVYT